MIPLALVRPEPGWSRSAAAARAVGLEVTGEPLFEIAPVPWERPARDAIDALLLGSANAPRHAGDLSSYAGMPAYAVGAATADAARAAGLAVVQTGDSNLQSLAHAIVPAHRRLLRLCGRERTAFMPPPFADATERVVYEAVPRPIGERFAETLRHRAVVALHSPRAARHFAAECDRLAIAREHLMIAVLSAEVAEACGQGWGQIAIATAPTDAALLATASSLCHNPGGGRVDSRTA